MYFCKMMMMMMMMMMIIIIIAIGWNKVLSSNVLFFGNEESKIPLC